MSDLRKAILQLPAGTTPAESDIFLCVQGVSGTPVTRKMTFAVLLTLFSTLFKGAWSGATTYTVGQIVESGGSAYQCVATSLNQAPPNATYWKLFVSKGSTGAAGSTWRNGADAPDNALGVDGDFYLRTSTDEVYKKSGGVYSIVGNFRGATGYSPQWIVASGVPGGGTGNNGDMYQNSATGDVYGPKAAGAWGSIVANITGPQGVQGEQGETGDVGPTGPAGDDSELTVHQSSVAGSEVSGTAETTVASLTLPVLGANDAVFFAAVFTRPATVVANTVLRVLHGGSIIATYVIDISTFTSFPLQHLLSNQNNVSSQLGGMSEAYDLIEGTVNTGSTSALVFKVENGDAADKITLRSLTVKVIKP